MLGKIAEIQRDLRRAAVLGVASGDINEATTPLERGICELLVELAQKTEELQIVLLDLEQRLARLEDAMLGVPREREAEPEEVLR